MKKRKVIVRQYVERMVEVEVTPGISMIDTHAEALNAIASHPSPNWVEVKNHTCVEVLLESK